MYGFYKGVDSNKASVYDDLMERMTVTHYRFMLTVIMIQIAMAIILFFIFDNMGSIDYNPLSYWIYSMVIPVGINSLVAAICYYVLKNAPNTEYGAYAVSFSSLIISGDIYLFHNVFEPGIILLCVPMIISCLYGSKRLTGLLCMGSTVLKIGIDFLRTTPLLPAYYVQADKMKEYGILNYLVFIIINLGIMKFCFRLISVEKEKSNLILKLEQQRNTADSMVKKEKIFRKKLSENKITEYVANISKNSFVDGGDVFSKLAQGEYLDYTTSMLNLLKIVVHPEDISVFSDFTDIGYFEARQIHSPRYSLRVRVSPAKMLSSLVLEEDVTLRLLSKEKEWLYISFNANIVTDPQDSSILLHVEILDVDDEMEKERELINELSLDALTGIYNRKTAEKKVGEYIARKVQGSLFMMDLDGFKAVNDNLGHPEGDKLLKETAAIIKDAFRTDDVTCRLGGDEFLIFAPGINRENALEKGKQLLYSLTRTINSPRGAELRVSTSIGLAFYPEDGDNYEDMYSRADAALYEAKRRGKGRVVLYSELDKKAD